MTKKEKESSKEKAQKNDNTENEVTEEISTQENELQEELDSTKEQLLRVTAEYANFRKRTEKEKSDTHAFATAKVIESLLGVVDNLERAVTSEQEDYDGLKKGVQMTFDGLMSAFGTLGVYVFGEIGEAFDPELHHAVMHVEDETLGKNVIADVFQKGYRLNDKIIRPAMVKTAN